METLNPPKSATDNYMANLCTINSILILFILYIAIIQKIVVFKQVFTCSTICMVFIIIQAKFQAYRKYLFHL